MDAFWQKITKIAKWQGGLRPGPTSDTIALHQFAGHTT